MKNFNRPGVVSGGSWRREIVNKAKGYSTEEKAAILQKAMYSTQPTFDDFRGRDGYSDKMLGADARYVRKRKEKIATKNQQDENEYARNDRWSAQAEPILAYIMNTDQFLPTRESFAHLAHEYDDLGNGTDIVFCVSSKNGGYITCSVDVATDTNPKYIAEKFIESGRMHKATPPWVANVHYCRHDDERWQEPEAPHFILGLMPSRIDDATDAVNIKDGLIAGRESDPKTDFKLASEMREQIIMQLAFLRAEVDVDNKSRIAKLSDLLNAVNAMLGRVCGVEGETKEERANDFEKKYKKTMEEMKEDLVYRHIINEAKKRTNFVRGKRIRRIDNAA